MSAPRDVLGRRPGSLRISVTDRCNLRCAYCMPEEEYVWLPHDQFLRFEELARLAGIFAGLGVDRVRLTGGEPLLRREVEVLVRLLAETPGVRDLAITTNGVVLARHAAELFGAGLHRVTVSLDTLRPDRFRALTRRDSLDAVIEGIDVAAASGRPLKIDSVLLQGTNDDEIFDLLDFARARGAELRFIEYMDVGGATRWHPERVVSRAEILARVAGRVGAVEPLPGRGSAPAERFRLPDGSIFGIVASTTAPFCAACDRVRLTADGRLYLCLYARTGLDLRGPMREGASDAELEALVRSAWSERTDRGAENRLREAQRSALLDRETLRRDPRLEMHTRGG